ncbi:MAG: PSD1 and planctomycete cytochrome C domain-containing protein [Verrucomicrobiales bacterium]|nr:PSD1 and planctomycete cytochrome C domain-containing protein [Verrucomicrobiales bacterium]
MMPHSTFFPQSLHLLWVVIVLIGYSGSRAAEDADVPNFAREVLPILSNKCFVCHGPDAKKDELRLDSYDGATVDLGGYQAINPDAPQESEVIHRIFDQKDPMPPKKAESQLTDREREILARWVKSGGNYTKHWAFVPPRKPDDAKASIDTLVEKSLKTAGYNFASPAAPSTLARRVALVLTGLPPEREQLNRYLANPDEQAYESLVDELLHSSRFGEHQARYWLDAVRYGDTHGLHLDNRRGIYPYRDWVVKAFNDGLPFDQFITWQIAGDLLPDPNLEQLTATGYVRMNPTTSEGGAIEAEFQAKNNFDRVENLGTVFLGMTLNCVRCHTHKYDPIVHREYYQLMAFFNSTAESPLDKNAYLYAPVIEVPGSLAEWEKWEVLKPAQDSLLTKARQIIKTEQLEPKLLSYARQTLNWKTENWRVTNDLPIPTSPDDAKDWKSIENAKLITNEKFGGSKVAKWIDFTLNLDRPQFLYYKSNSEIRSDLGTDRIALLPGDAGEHHIRASLRGIDGKMKAEFQIINPWETLAKKKQWSSASELDQVLMVGDPNTSLFPEDLQREAKKLSVQLLKLRSYFTTTLVAKDLATPRETKVLERGEYNMPIGEALEPGVFAVMNPFPADAPKNRLGLAEWLTAENHPLVTRVLVNRVWQSVFGEGIVRSPEDFGLQGRQPTHPELLDWLAVSFREQGWNYRKLIKPMVMSRTFRQDSARRSDIPGDPDNLLLARGPVFRLDAEVIRDTGLWASGLLEARMGGEGVKPYQPGGLWSALAHPASNTKNYIPDIDKRVNERSLYVYWKRTSPHPMMTLFDAPSREVSCVRRSRGNTPLQSLGLLNEPQRMEMARAYSRKLLTTEEAEKDRLDEIFKSLTCRPPTEIEQNACLTLLKQAKERYRKDPGAATALTGSDTASPELAAWIQVVNMILASDSAILLY